MRFSIRSIWQNIRTRLQTTESSRRDAAEHPAPDLDEVPEIAFDTFDPDVSLQVILDETWIRRHSEPYLLDRALQLIREYRVLIKHFDSTSIEAAIEEAVPTQQKMRLEPQGLMTECTCRANRTVAGANQASRPNALDCEHLTAVLLYVAKEYRNRSQDAANGPCLCPITRQPLVPPKPIYRCKRCSMSYSAEGWEFLRTADRGRCCNCHCRHTIRKV